MASPSGTRVTALVPVQPAVQVPPRDGIGIAVVSSLLALVLTLCWACLLVCAGRMAPVGAGAFRHAADPARLLALWPVAVAALMLPAAAPSVLLYARVKRLRREQGVHLSTFLFALGCLSVWCGCALAAALAGGLLHEAGALDEAMAIREPVAGALALVAAGVYQWTPAKHACLENCRAPLAFLRTHWRRGTAGAFRMGAADARYAAGCWWLLMALLLPAGVLNLPVIAGLSVLILAEKLAPGGPWLACASGLGLVIWGTALLFP